MGALDQLTRAHEGKELGAHDDEQADQDDNEQPDDFWGQAGLALAVDVAAAARGALDEHRLQRLLATGAADILAADRPAALGADQALKG